MDYWQRQADVSTLECFLVPVVLLEDVSRFWVRDGPYLQLSTPFAGIRWVWQADLASTHIQGSGSNGTAFGQVFKRYGSKCAFIKVKCVLQTVFVAMVQSPEDNVRLLCWLLYCFFELFFCPVPFHVNGL